MIRQIHEDGNEEDDGVVSKCIAEVAGCQCDDGAL
jgi:hypothetical protein